MPKEINPYVKKLTISLEIVGTLQIIGIILVLVFPFAKNLVASNTIELIAYVIGASIGAVFIFLCAWGLKKNNKIAYYATWISLIPIILGLRLIGLILAIFMIIWLVKSKKIFIS